MKRKLLALLTVLLLVVTMATPAFADVIWEPRNSFYELNRDECEYVNRTYLANGREGYVSITKSPKSSSEILNVSNGTTVYVSFVWTAKDGTQWGIGYPAGVFDKEGWMPLTALAQIYDYRDFEDDHGAEFKDYDGSGDHLTEACAYAYPGGIYQSKLEHWGDGNFGLSDCFDVLYTDENGLRWSYVGYYYGHRNCWVCIDDPMNENLGIESARTVDQMRGSNPIEELRPAAIGVPAARTFPLWIIPLLLVIVVAVVTAVLVRKRRKNA